MLVLFVSYSTYGFYFFTFHRLWYTLTGEQTFFVGKMAVLLLWFPLLLVTEISFGVVFTFHVCL